jgi:plasmid stabilization system protein ParE
MARLKVTWTATAIKQRNQVFEYWNNRNKSTAYSKKLNGKIKERIDLLKTNPHLAKNTEFEPTRAISLGHYSILYKIIDLDIFITGFWDNRQDPKRLLAFLKNN